MPESSRKLPAVVSIQQRVIEGADVSWQSVAPSIPFPVVGGDKEGRLHKSNLLISRLLESSGLKLARALY